MNRREVERLFVNECGFFGLNVKKITKVIMYPELDYSILVYFDDSGIPCFMLRHRTERSMQATYSNIMAIKDGKHAKIYDLNEYRSRRKKDE